MDARFSFLKDGSASKAMLRTTFEHRVPEPEGQVELIYWAARHGTLSPPEQIILFILGNPGMPSFYIPFLDYLHSLLPPSHAIIMTSHLGHSTVVPFPPKPIILPGQLESKFELVKALRSSLDTWAEESGATKPRLALMGHSLGSWLSVEVMKEFGDDIYAAYLLHPTVGRIADSRNGRMLWPVFTPPITSFLSFFSPVIRPFLPFVPAPKPSKDFLSSPRILKNVLTLARSEMALMGDPDEAFFKAHGEGLYTSDPDLLGAAEGGGIGGRGVFGCYSGGDIDWWVGKEGPVVRGWLGGEGRRTILMDGVPHGFCLDEKDWKIVAGIVSGWVNPQRSTPAEVVDQEGTGSTKPVPM